jgi:O-acetyl-ADP-ribose deacetylase (regulator of RNase III)
LVQARKKLELIQTSEVMYTKVYNLTSKYVIHTVGPIYSEGNKDQDIEPECLG